jgi:outer membrane biosynthesis protein TonB
VRREGLFSICAMALIFGGCPKRQTAPRIVYIPAPPPQASPHAATHQDVLVIEEPTPAPEPGETSPQASPETPPARRRRPAPHTATPPEPEVVPAETTEVPQVEVPALVPRESGAQEVALRSQIQAMQEKVRGRMAHLNEARLSLTERKTLDDARTFLTQSTRALEGGDLQRALNLARKASLLVSALE